MKFGFMSSVYPQLSLEELVAKAVDFDCAHVELRVEWGHKHGIELGISDYELVRAGNLFAREGIEVSCISTSVRFLDRDPSFRKKQEVFLKKYISLAHMVKASNVRIFADPVPRHPFFANELFNWTAESIRECDPIAKEAGINIVLETHKNLLASYATEILHRAAPTTNTFINWHTMHHIRYGQDIMTAYTHIQNKVKHMHVNFGIDNLEGMPEPEKHALSLLKRDEYDGFISVEMINPVDPDGVFKET